MRRGLHSLPEVVIERLEMIEHVGEMYVEAWTKIHATVMQRKAQIPSDDRSGPMDEGADGILR
jgi:hypothetical protein